MTLLDELKPVRAPDKPRRVTWQRIALGVGVAVAMLAAAGIPIYADHYQPIAMGSTFGGSEKLVSLNDGLSETGLRITAAGSPADISISIRNSGRFGVRVLAVGDAPEQGYIPDVSVRATGLNSGGPNEHVCCDANAEPFHSFWLAPGQERRIQLTLTAQPCAANADGASERIDVVRVRYRFLGTTSETWVPLSGRQPIVRYCPDNAFPLRDAASAAPDDGFVPSGYNFGVPRGWTAKPLENFGGPASFASWTSPDGKSKVEYEVNGGMAGVLYDDSNQPTEAGARDATGCDLTAFRPQYGSAYEYTCRGTPATKGILRTGVIRIQPYPEGFERIEIRSSDMALVTAFLESIKT